MNLHYSVVVKWSDEDQAYLVFLPEFGEQPRTHGETYKEAMKNAEQVLELLVESYQAEGWPLPAPAKYAAPAHV